MAGPAGPACLRRPQGSASWDQGHSASSLSQAPVRAHQEATFRVAGECCRGLGGLLPSRKGRGRSRAPRWMHWGPHGGGWGGGCCGGRESRKSPKSRSFHKWRCGLRVRAQASGAQSCGQQGQAKVKASPRHPAPMQGACPLPSLSAGHGPAEVSPTPCPQPCPAALSSAHLGPGSAPGPSAVNPVPPVGRNGQCGGGLHRGLL